MAKRQLIVDSSVAVKWVNGNDEKNLDQADKIIADLEANKLELVAPELAKFELGNALLNKKISPEGTKASLASYYGIPISFISWDQNLAEDTMDMAFENKITYYDASFMVLAKKFGATLVTDNPKHQKQVAGVKVVSLKDY